MSLDTLAMSLTERSRIAVTAGTVIAALGGAAVAGQWVARVPSVIEVREQAHEQRAQHEAAAHAVLDVRLRDIDTRLERIDGKLDALIEAAQGAAHVRRSAR